MNTTGGRSSNWTIDLGIEEAMMQDLSALSDQPTAGRLDGDMERLIESMDHAEVGNPAALSPEAIASLVPDAAREHFTEAVECVRAEAWSDAATSLRAILLCDPARRYSSSHMALLLLGHVFLAEDNPTEALAVFDEAARLQPELTGLHAARGVAYLACGKDMLAMAAFQRAIVDDPRRRALHYNLGNIHARLGDPNAAESAYREALMVDPTDVRTLNNLAVVLVELRRFDEAVPYLEQACSCDIPQHSHQRNLALALGLAGRWDASIGHLEHLRRNDHACPQIRITLARVLRCAGRGRESLKYLDESLDWGCWEAARHEMIGLVHADEGDGDRALMFWELAVADNPAMGRVYVHMVELHLDRKQVADAEQAAAKAVAATPAQADAWLSEGRVHFFKGRLENADNTFRHAISLDPACDRAHYWLARTQLRRCDSRGAHHSLRELEGLRSPLANAIRSMVR
jgi:Flp pilus assembly protein TadD